MKLRFKKIYSITYHSFRYITVQESDTNVLRVECVSVGVRVTAIMLNPRS